jgi:hypothetical protein
VSMMTTDALSDLDSLMARWVVNMLCCIIITDCVVSCRVVSCYVVLGWDVR